MQKALSFRYWMISFYLALFGPGLFITSATGIETPLQQASGKEQGFGPLLNGSKGLPPSNSNSGAINSAMTFGASSEILYVGSVSGGVWVTANATSPSPNWTPLTDQFLKQYSIVSLASSPLRPATIFAGTGSTSSADTFNGVGLGIGVVRSLNGGLTWETFDQPGLQGRAVSSVVPTKLNRGQTILAATWLNPNGADDRSGGVWRSDDNGKTFRLISGSAGLPAAGVSSLIGDPMNPNVFYAAAPQLCEPKKDGTCKPETGGIYIGIADKQTSINWTKIAQMEELNNAQRILLSIHSSPKKNSLYALIISWPAETSGPSTGKVFRSSTLGHPPASWLDITGQLGNEHFPLFSHSGRWHGAIGADPGPGNDDIVYVAGDELESDQEAKLGCKDHNAPVYRFNGMTWESVICRGANKTAPHADGRSITFNARGDLLFTNDGGIARLINPGNSESRRWQSVVGNLRTTEFRSVALDPISNVLIGGAQDNGASYQLSPGNFAWCQLIGGDGGDVSIDSDQNRHPGSSIRYLSSQKLGCFHRITWNPKNQITLDEDVALIITSGHGSPKKLLDFDQESISFVQPYALNAIDPSRMLIATTYLFESFDRGDSLRNLGCFTEGGFLAHAPCPTSGALNSGTNPYAGKPIVYGGRRKDVDFADMLYVGASSMPTGKGAVFHRVQATDSPTMLESYPGSQVVSIAVDRRDYTHVFVSDSNNQIWGSVDEGKTWSNLTPQFSGRNLPLVTKVETGDTSFSSSLPMLFAGGLGLSQCALSLTAKGLKCSWSPVDGIGFKPVITDIRFEPITHRLVIGTLGRGAWLYGASLSLKSLPDLIESSSKLCPKKPSCSDSAD